eukprot:SAG11_NODE_22413_length_406_cov_1.179153_1_plen_94_part_10
MANRWVAVGLLPIGPNMGGGSSTAAYSFDDITTMQGTLSPGRHTISGARHTSHSHSAVSKSLPSGCEGQDAPAVGDDAIAQAVNALQQTSQELD